ncbi:MAG: HIT domain-containing protein [Patescibacteria group bacterium]|jgi:diadenosine tetraphosphate (Ap4A) HIT family hydrolase
MENCNFCLENNKLEGTVLAKNDFCYFVESIDPVIRHAGMIITYRHVLTPFEISDEEWLSIKSLLGEVKVILDKYNPSGYNIGWNIGDDAGQNVNHTHLHIIARFPDEPLRGKGIRHAFKQETNKRPSITY